jgi:hypothetical protein
MAVHFLHLFSEPIYAAILLSFLLLVLLVIFRKKGWAIGAFWVLSLMPGLISGINGSWTLMLGEIVLAALMTIALTRFGLLALYSYLFFNNLTAGNPITSDLSSWYARNTIFVFAIVAALAVYAFYTAKAKQQIFNGKIAL